MWDDACRWARPRLPLMAGGELAGHDRRKAERHLIGCPDCRKHLDSLHEALGALHALASAPAPAAEAPSLWPALARQIRETRRPAPSFWATLGLRPVGWLGAALAASLLVVVVAAGSWSLAHYYRGQKPQMASLPNSRPRPAVVHRAPAAPEVRETVRVAEASATSRPEAESVAQAAPSPAKTPARRGANTPAVVNRPPSEPTH